MHQPYYKNILDNSVDLPWVRLHGSKDYVDMVQMLGKYPLIHQTFNIVPSLFEQVEDYVNKNIKDKYFDLSSKPASELNEREKAFILEHFFSINKDKVISTHPRYYELYLKKAAGKPFDNQDYLDLQVWFNLSWIDPYFRQDMPELRVITAKGRHFSEGDKRAVLDKQLSILAGILPVYKQFQSSGQIEVTVTPYYHPILPLLYNTNIGKEANPKTKLPGINFSFPQDAKAQVEEAVKFYQDRFGASPSGMWPSEESVSEHIIPFLINAGIKWIVADEAILYKSLKCKKRDPRLLYHPYLLKREEGNLNIVFRDRNLSDLIGFVYNNWEAETAVSDFMKHLHNIAHAFRDKDILVCIAMDGENAWEYYRNDGHDFLELLYARISEAKFLKTTTIKEYLEAHPPEAGIPRIAAGSWIFAEFAKWIGNPHKNLAWEYLTKARQEFEAVKENLPKQKLDLARKQIYIAEGSDWFWWYGDNQQDFDRLFRMHLSNFYTIIGKEIPEYLKSPLTPY